MYNVHTPYSLIRIPTLLPHATKDCAVRATPNYTCILRVR